MTTTSSTREASAGTSRPRAHRSAGRDAGPRVRLAPGPPVEPLPPLGPDQRAVLDAARGASVVRVAGAPGSGRTTTALALALDALDRGVPPARLLLLAPGRLRAARLRSRLSGLTRVVTRGALVRTPSSLAVHVLVEQSRALGEGRAPTLLSGAEQDAVLADLLAGHLAGDGVPLALPDGLPEEVLGRPAFRQELRDLLMRAAERGLEPADLDRLATEHARPEWHLAAQVFEEYREVVGWRAGATQDAIERHDPASVAIAAAGTLAGWTGPDRPTWDLVVVDDVQDLTEADGDLLAVLHGDGARLVLLGDPDQAVETHRGAVPRLLAEATFGGAIGWRPASAAAAAAADVARRAGGARASEDDVLLTLAEVRRHGPVLRAAVHRVTAHIRPAGVHRHRDASATVLGASLDAAEPYPTPDPVTVAVLPSRAGEVAYVAHVVREAALVHGLAWSQIAVVCRAGAQVTAVRSALARASVPLRVHGSDVPLRAEPAVRPLLEAMSCVLADRGGTPLDEVSATALLTSPLGDVDALGLRRLRRALRAEELTGGGYRASGVLLVEALEDPARTATLPVDVRTRVERLARILAAGRDAAEQPTAGAQEVLWALWEASGLEAPWRRRALEGGVAGARADRDLDAVMGLFKEAERFGERMPHSPPIRFVEMLRSEDVPGDVLARRALVEDAVTVCTAANATGQEWDLVVVPGVQDGVWPDLRLRDTLLGARDLVDAVRGALPAANDEQARAEQARQARREVLDDELRTFAVATSRARRRLVVTAIQDADERPSVFLDLLDPPGELDDGPDAPGPAEAASLALARRRVTPPPPLDLRGLVSELRTTLVRGCDPGVDAALRPAPETTSAAAATLAVLAAARVPGADPAQWFGLAAQSTDAPLHAPDDTVVVSPSRVEVVDQCPLRWALVSAGGDRAGELASASIGTLVHEIAADLPRGTLDEMQVALEQRWGRLGLPDTWSSRRDREHAEKMIERLAGYVASHGDVVAVEVPVDVVLPGLGVRVIGRADRVERTSEGLRVVDLKTGRTAATAEETRRHPQLGVYQLAIEAGALAEGDVAAGASLVHVGTPTKAASTREQAPLSQDVEPGWARDLLVRVRGEMSGPQMRVTTGPTCRHCPVRRSCPIQGDGEQVTA